MKHLRYFAAAAVFIGGCGVLPALAQAPTARYTLDLSWKDVAFTNSMALAELAIVEVRNIGNATPEGLIYYLSDREGTAMALGTNIVAGTVSNSSVGVLNLQTSELRAFFAGLNPYAERTFSFSVWDSANDILLGSGPVAVRNNPLADQLLTGWTNVPEVVESELLAAIAGLVAMVDAGDTIARADISSLQEALYNLEIGGVNFGTGDHDAARGDWFASLSNAVDSIEVGGVDYGTNSTTAYRGDWGASVSNLATSAYSLAISNDNAVLRSIRTVPAVAAYAEAGASDLPWLATNSASLILSGLTSGSIGIRVETTNDTGIALYSVAVKDSGGEVLATIHPACDGTRQSASWPWNASETLTIEATGIASPAEGAESAIITAAQVETWGDVSLVGKTNDLADQHLYVDYPAATNEAANRAYADDAADAALALALGEIGTATFNRDLAGYVQRWNPRFDTVADSNSLSTLYGGSTALRLDGEGAAVVPEIRAFAVESGEVATLTVWSYSGGATNLVPEVTTNLITGTWEKKPESIVSATNIDAFTAQVVFTNDFERLLYVRLVDVSGGSGVPVFRVFGGIAFGDGEAITDWPTSGTGTGWTNLAFSGTGNAITNATAAGDTLTLERGTIEGGGGGGIDAAEAGQIATNVASGYLPLSGYDGLVVLGTRTRGYAASTNLGNYGFAAGFNTSAGDYGFAAGANTSAGDFGFAAGANTSAGYAGFAAGADTTAGDAGFAAGDRASAGDFGFAAGRAAKGADGSFIFADNSTGGTPFNRTNRPNEFSARAAGGVYFDTPMMTVTGTVSAGSITLGTNAPITDWPTSGGGWTNLSFSGTGNVITNATAAGDTLTLERGTIEGGGGGTADPFSSILVSADWTWTNAIYAVGADTSSTNIAVTLPDAGTNFASVVIRKFSNLNQLQIVRGTNVVYTLYDDGSTRAFDWWPQRTNWFWRN